MQRKYHIEASKLTLKDVLLTFSSRSATARKERIRSIHRASDSVTIVTNSGRYIVNPDTRLQVEARAKI